MTDEAGLAALLELLSNRRVLKRKEAIKRLRAYLHRQDAYLMWLSLHYVSEHDPTYTVRNLARQAFYGAGIPLPKGALWDEAHIF
jgi:hypothetical protein